MHRKRSVIIAFAIVACLVIGLIVFIARHSLAGTWSGTYTGPTSGTYTGASAPTTVSLILNRDRTGDLLVTPSGVNEDLHWQRHGHKVFLYASTPAAGAPNTPFATGTVSDRADVLNLSLSSEAIDPASTGGTAAVVLARFHAH